MQLLARTPRGTANEMAALMEDHRIYVLFEGNMPSAARGGDVQRTNKVITARKRELDEAGVAAENEALRCADVCARNDIEYAPVAPRMSGALNGLKAAVTLYRRGHAGRAHVERYFELAMKNGFEQSEQMAPLTAEEDAAIVQINLQMQQNAPMMNKLDEIWANDNPSNIPARFDRLIS
eukprot:3594756-Prymnesium_polylepis.1